MLKVIINTYCSKLSRTNTNFQWHKHWQKMWTWNKWFLEIIFGTKPWCGGWLGFYLCNCVTFGSDWFCGAVLIVSFHPCAKIDWNKVLTLQLFRQALLNSHTNVYLYFATKKTSNNPGNPVTVLMPLHIWLEWVLLQQTCVCSNKSHLRDSWCLYHLNKETNFCWLNNSIIMCLSRRKARGRLFYHTQYSTITSKNDTTNEILV